MTRRLREAAPAPRRRRIVLAVAAGALIGTGGCSGPPAPAAPLSGDDGWQSATHTMPSSTRPSAARPHAIPSVKRKPWAKQGLLPELSAAGTRGPSEHLGGAYERSVRVNAAAAGYAERGSRTPLPMGALIVQLHHLPGEDTMATAYVMEKRDSGHAPQRGDWDYLVLDERWRVESRSTGELCASCHLAAPRDSVFGLSRD